MAYDAVQSITEIDIYFVISSILLAGAFAFACKQQAGATIGKYTLPASLVLLVIYGVTCCLRTSKKITHATYISVIGSVCLVELFGKWVLSLQEILQDESGSDRSECARAGDGRGRTGRLLSFGTDELHGTG